MSGDSPGRPSPKSQAYVAGVNVSVTSTVSRCCSWWSSGWVSEVVQERNGLSAHGPVLVVVTSTV